MTLEFIPMADSHAIEVKGIDSVPLNAADSQQLRRAFNDSALLVIRDLELSNESHIEFTRAFGDLVIHPLEFLRHRDYPEIIELSTSPEEPLAADDPSGDEIVAYSGWHTDLTFDPVPSLGGFLRPIEIPPESGYTAYMDAAEIYQALPDKTKQTLRGLTVIHSLLDNSDGVAKDADIDFPYEVQAMADVIHPLVFNHPHNGRPVLFISPTFTRRIVGFSQEASDQLLGELKEFAANERFSYVHVWQPNDLVIWDNWQSIHKGYGHKKKYRRVMHRTTLKGDRNLMDYLMP
ncbi:MAG: hypothetical protein VR73_13650 [Gammaproteobacteria bacterium BRH_c0]|nr:MAG: hypothetical protein VR73_13650 [Gammaproteobacteria bacterium BRH_c0]